MKFYQVEYTSLIFIHKEKIQYATFKSETEPKRYHRVLLDNDIIDIIFINSFKEIDSSEIKNQNSLYTLIDPIMVDSNVYMNDVVMFQKNRQKESSCFFDPELGKYFTEYSDDSEAGWYGTSEYVIHYFKGKRIWEYLISYDSSDFSGSNYNRFKY